jgi:UDP-N-acetylglucosamine acyltransferase
MSGIAKSARIHPMAVVEDGAMLGEGVSIGPFCHVGPKVVLHDNVQLLTHAVVTGRTTIGKGGKIFAMAVVGGDPQSVHHGGEDTSLTIGENCTIREGVTINTGTAEFGGKTIVGDARSLAVGAPCISLPASAGRPSSAVSRPSITTSFPTAC